MRRVLFPLARGVLRLDTITMATKPQDPKPSEQANEQGQLNALIGANVVRTLGQPTGLHKIHVHSLWADRFRVNILVGPDVVSATVAHSYFLVADSKGNIVTSIPEIVRSY